MHNDLVFDFIAVLQILSRGGAEGKSISLDVSQGNGVKFSRRIFIDMLHLYGTREEY